MRSLLHLKQTHLRIFMISFMCCMKNTGRAISMQPKYPGVWMYVWPSVGQIVPGPRTPILGSKSPPGTSLLFMYVSLETTSTTAAFRISSGDDMANWMPMMREGFLYGSCLWWLFLCIIYLYIYSGGGFLLWIVFFCFLLLKKKQFDSLINFFMIAQTKS